MSDQASTPTTSFWRNAEGLQNVQKDAKGGIEIQSQAHSIRGPPALWSRVSSFV
jgi:hypothetical protein